ncbi:hypothetical protein N8D56_07955 [Devosia sp. A8/3-2]|nr:hypothetical protein N8D56_07955 [Devosia sp. A8/3-2]
MGRADSGDLRLGLGIDRGIDFRRDLFGIAQRSLEGGRKAGPAIKRAMSGR